MKHYPLGEPSRIWRLALFASLLLASSSLTAQTQKPKDSRLCSGCRLLSSQPSERLSFGASQRFDLRGAHAAASRRVASQDRCRALFDSLELEGPSALDTLHLRPPQSVGERAVCGTGAAAFTTVGNGQVLVCERFHRLSRRSQMAVLIHEALHKAGLGEAPNDPDGMTSLEITRMVKKACSL